MRYKTSDLSKILNVSTNTIRRFENMGYLNPSKEEDNGYRYFKDADVAKTVFISKYRKIGFGHEAISEIFQSDIMSITEMFQEYMADLDKQIAHLTAVRHMLKDDVVLIKRIKELGQDIIEHPSNAFYYVLYNRKGKLCCSGKNGEMIHRFMYQCPEIKYIYIIDKEDAENRRLEFSEGLAMKQHFTKTYNVQVEEPAKAYDVQPSLMGIVRIPIDFMNEDIISREEVKKLVYDRFFTYMEENNYCLDGDVIGIKMGLSHEEEQEWQYAFFSFPVKENEATE